MNKSIKRFTAFLLAIAVIFTQSFVTFANDHSNTRYADDIISEMYVNPLYENQNQESDLQEEAGNSSISSYANEEIEYLTSKEECAAILREGMKQRQETIKVYYEAEAYVNGLGTEIIKLACKHTGNPTEGDYLLACFKNVKVGGTKETLGNVCRMNFVFTPVYNTNAEQEEAVTARTHEVLDELNVYNKSDYQKVRAIYDYICSHVEYDDEHKNDEDYRLQFSAYGALIDGKAVCQGYSVLFYRMALELGVDNRLIPGKTSSETHGWNIVELNDLYYNLDTTWDAGKETYKYFLKCEANFPNHTRDEDYATDEFYQSYPMSSEDYAIPVMCEAGQHQYEGTFTWTESTDDDGIVNGYTAVRADVTCSKCGDVNKDLEAVVTKDEEQSILPTCSEPGKDVYVAVATVKDADGNEVGSASDKKEVVVPATSQHSYGEWQTVKESTYKENGLQKAVCTVCGSEITEELPVLTAESISLSDTKCSLETGENIILTAVCDPVAEKPEEIDWKSNNEDIATVESDAGTAKVTGRKAGTTEITASVGGKTATCVVTVTGASVQYQTHIQDYGWTQGWRINGETSGTSGESRRLEAIQIRIADSKYNGSIQYTTHIQDIGWENKSEEDWKEDGEVSGTSGKSKRLEAIRIRLTGQLEEKYDIYYRVHAQDYGWLDWAKNGEEAGTSGLSKRLEAIEIVLIQKGAQAPGKTDKPYVMKTISYQTHIQDYGWKQGWKMNGAVSGTSGESKRLEAIQIKLENQKYSGSIQYTTHIQDIGWETADENEWKSNGATSGTSGKSKRLEAIRIRLTGEMAKHYDVYYRVHAQNLGWMGWTKNGLPAGTSGYSYRLEAIQIQLVPKGESIEGNTDNSYKQK